MADFPSCNFTRSALFKNVPGMVAAATRGHVSKVAVVGAGAVGMACAYAILNRGLASELVLVDVDAARVRGEHLDLMHGSAFFKRCNIASSTDPRAVEGADVVIVTAGVRQQVGESRLDLVGRNVDLFGKIIPSVARHAPDTTFCVLSNPCDIMTYVTWKFSGFPTNRVFGSGTALDSSRFRAILGSRLGLDTRSVDAYVLGEHGDSSVAAWSTVTVGGVRLASINPKLGRRDDPEGWYLVHQQVIDSAREIIKAKGYTSWAIGATTASLVESVLRDEQAVFPISTLVQGMYGIEHEVFLSLPCVLGRAGIISAVNIDLTEREQEQLRKSADTVCAVQRKLQQFGAA